MSRINIRFTRFSAFYSPLICAVSGGFLNREGLEPECSVAAPGVSALTALEDGSAHVVQSALSQGLNALENGKMPGAVHFAQINEMDGFFLTGREPDPEFSWGKLQAARVLVDHAAQPLAMFRYACHRRGVDFRDLDVVDAGSVDEMDAAFRSGIGEYIHQQGPAPQQLEHDGAGAVVASVGEAIGPCGFSSLAARPEWLDTDMARSFMRAYRGARRFINDMPAAEIAAAETKWFPGIDRLVLTRAIAYYQTLGCWTPHAEITRAAFEKTQDVFQFSGALSRRYDYAAVCARPPDESPEVFS
ncbi:MAG: hypothetical protein DWQ08_13050 [Proteobacteria bacterium]|nr:MAG: hypothetical protein DWQ08_13050 [Pseudomonadota bacterium]